MSQKVFDLLNAARSRELTAISQYMVQHYELEDKDFGKLGKKMKEVAIQEMKHAEALAERILFLKGEPTTKPDAATVRRTGNSRHANNRYRPWRMRPSRCTTKPRSSALPRKIRYPRNSSKNFWPRRKTTSTSLRIPRNNVEKLGAAYMATLAG